MKVARWYWTSETGWDRQPTGVAADLVFVFAPRILATDERLQQALRRTFPRARIVSTSTSGQFVGRDVEDDVVVALSLAFAGPKPRVTAVPLGDNGLQAGRAIGRELRDTGLVAVFVLSDGLHVDGTQLVEGMRSEVGETVAISGGLAGDGAAFERTYVGLDGLIAERQVVAVGLYGDRIRVSAGCAGGWDGFGPMRRITRSSGSTLLELDGAPALDLYRKYLGPEFMNLPHTALLYPLLISRADDGKGGLVRTVLAVDHAVGSLRFAGTMPEGWYARLMRGYFDRLADAAATATSMASSRHSNQTGDMAAIFVSCVGRRLLMGPSIADEIVAAEELLPANAIAAGFYSYGEIAPDFATGRCDLHNQTMTVTLISEV